MVSYFWLNRKLLSYSHAIVVVCRSIQRGRFSFLFYIIVLTSNQFFFSFESPYLSAFSLAQILSGNYLQLGSTSIVFFLLLKLKLNKADMLSFKSFLTTVPYLFQYLVDQRKIAFFFQDFTRGKKKVSNWLNYAAYNAQYDAFKEYIYLMNQMI